MTSGALVQVGRPPATRGFDGAAVPKERFDPEPPWTPEERAEDSCSGALRAAPFAG